MKNSRQTWLALLALLLLEMIFWHYALTPGQTFFLRDLSAEIIPKRAFWAQSHGFALWAPYGFFGMPFAANPQSEAFYPLNFLFLLFGAERGLVFYTVLHHFLFLSTFCLALRRLGFGTDSSLIAAVAFGFGGFFCSLTLLIVLLSTLAWFPLIVICLSLALEKNWLRHSLLLGPLLALQVLAGEIEMAVMSWVLALCAVALAPAGKFRRSDFLKAMAGLGLGGLFGALLSAFQIALTLEMIPLSNRASGVGLADATFWSFQLSQLKFVFIPNYIISPELLAQKFGIYWGLGFFTRYLYLLSFYLGISVPLLAGLAFRRKTLATSLPWVLLALLALAMMAGEQIPLYQFLYRVVPGFNLFRLPTKFFFVFNFALVMLGATGWQGLEKKSLPKTATILLASAAALAAYLALSPLGLYALGDSFGLVESRFFLRSALKTLAFLLAAAGLVLWAGPKNKFRMGTLLAALCFVDLYLAHRFLNMPAPAEIYQGSETIREFVKASRARVAPPRILPLARSEREWDVEKVVNPLEKCRRLWNGLEGYAPVYYGLQDYRAYSSFHLADISAYNDLLYHTRFEERKLLLGRSGIEYAFYRERGFEPLGALPRAMLFYRAAGLRDRSEILKLLPEPNFPARQTLLLEVIPEKNSGQDPASEPAQITVYQNEKVVIQARARQKGWVLLLDSWYPGWEAEVDGRPVEILRANGFFRAVEVPAGEHTVTFRYRPAIFCRAVLVSAAGFALWLGMMLFSFKISKSGK